jgi:hypothetical protein
MSEQRYPGQTEDEARRKAGEGLLAYMVERGVIEAPEPEPEEETEEEPTFRQQLEAAKFQRQESLAGLFMASMGSALAPQPDAPTGPTFGPAAAERERAAPEGGA